jgi:Spy/CpxP family protein refolding chaperone
MKRLLLAGVMALSASATLLGAQGPGGGRPGPAPDQMGRGGPRGGPVDNPAEFLLSQTGDLKLTDAQVTRLAAIARRSAERRQALRTQMDSARGQMPRGQRPDSAMRAQMRQRVEQMRPAMDRLREQSQADRRDAIAVLTPDQQATAWERIARMGQRQGAARGRGFGGRPGRGGMGPRQMGPDRGQPDGPRRMGPPGGGERRRPE